MTKYFVKNTGTGEAIGDAYFDTEKEAEYFRNKLISTSIEVSFPPVYDLDGFIFPSMKCVTVNMNYRKSNTVVCKKEEPKLQLEVGKFYRTRSGKKTFIFTIEEKSRSFYTGETNFTFNGVEINSGDDNVFYYSENGVNGRLSESDHDLIAEWEEENK